MKLPMPKYIRFWCEWVNKTDGLSHVPMCTNPCWGNLRHDLRTQRDAGNLDEPKSQRKTCHAQRFSEGRDLLRIGHPQHRIVGWLGGERMAQVRRGTLPADAAWPI